MSCVRGWRAGGHRVAAEAPHAVEPFGVVFCNGVSINVEMRNRCGKTFAAAAFYIIGIIISVTLPAK